MVCHSTRLSSCYSLDSTRFMLLDRRHDSAHVIRLTWRSCYSLDSAHVIRSIRRSCYSLETTLLISLVSGCKPQRSGEKLNISATLRNWATSKLWIRLSIRTAQLKRANWFLRTSGHNGETFDTRLRQRQKSTLAPPIIGSGNADNRVWHTKRLLTIKFGNAERSTVWTSSNT
jgi:hypothetical protein